MKHIKAFNKSIEDLICEKNNVAYQTIALLKNEISSFRDYYSLLDNVSFKVGFGMIAEEYIDKYSETIGYIPKLIYFPHNKLSEAPRVEGLDIIEPINIELCYETLAKACLYRLSKISNLKSLINQKQLLITNLWI